VADGEPGMERNAVESSLSQVEITYSHKLLELLALHARGKFALFRCVKSAWYSSSANDPGKQRDGKGGKGKKGGNSCLPVHGER
jgi:hypothetical protein